MDIRVAGHQVDTGEALRTHVSDRMSGIADKYFARAVAANVTFSRGPNDFFACDIVAPVDYKAIDGARVDLVFLLLSPPDAGAEHLKALAAVSRLVRHAPTVEKLRGARTRDALAAVLIGADERDAA